MDTEKILNSMKKPKVFVPIIVMVALIVGGLSVWSYRKGVDNQGERRQERVEKTYQSAQNSLSTCLDQGRTAAQVTEQEFEQLKSILVDVASARYVDKDGNPTNAADAIGGGQLFSMVQEAYPSIDQASFQNLQTIVVGCRDEYQGAQDRLFNEVAEFDTWVQEDNVWNQGIKNNFPTDTLDAVDLGTGEVLKGQAALDYMSRVILVGDARDAYTDGELDEQDLFEEEGGN
ncbi:hypothetical protein KBD20_01555 [Candidatus Saccharibacteria bacterium]|nr:hypothetical protein [Candidatus Saccharibacteria bacterium]